MKKFYSADWRFHLYVMCLILFFIGQSVHNVYSEGTKQLAPSRSDRLYLALCMREYGNFGRYNGNSDQRLYIHIENPSKEKVFFGFHQFVSSGHYPYSGRKINAYIRIKDPLGNVVWPEKNQLKGKLIKSGNISSWDQAVAGPKVIAGRFGYDAYVFDPSGLTKGDYYIEFSHTPSEYSSQDMFTEFWDITVATRETHPGPINGRVWSKNWAFQSPATWHWEYSHFKHWYRQKDDWFGRSFNGAVYSYCTDPNFEGGYVTEVDFRESGFRGAAFNLAFNWSGTDTTDDFSVNRKSVPEENRLSPEFPIFLNDPDHEVYPSAEAYGRFIKDEIKECPRLFGCPGNYYFHVAVEKKGRIEMILDFNKNGKFDPNTRDRVITQLFKPYDNELDPLIRDIFWDGNDGLGEQITESEVFVIFDYIQGTFHFPMYDVEFMTRGLIPRTVRPVPPKTVNEDGVAVDYVPKLYWDDSNIDGQLMNNQPKFELTGAPAPSHAWDQYNYYTDKGYGNRNSINTYWNSYSSGSSNSFLFELPHHGCELFVPGSISGMVFNDVNRDGEWDVDTELPKEGVKVFIYQDVNNNKIFDDEDPLVDTLRTKTPGTFGYPEGTGNFLYKPEIGHEYFVGVASETDLITTDNYRYYTMYSIGTEHFDQLFGVTDAPVVSLSVDNPVLTEDSQTAIITASLDYAPIFPVTVKLNYGGSASADDYTSVPGSNAIDAYTLEYKIGETVAKVKVSSLDDKVAEDDENVVVSVHSTTNCVTKLSSSQTITIKDDDEAGVILSKNSVEVSEQGVQDQFTVQLSSKPKCDATLSLYSTELSEALVSPQEIIFTPGNWELPQTVIVTGVDDPVDDDDKLFHIVLFKFSSDDNFYDGAMNVDVVGVNKDNDEAGLFVSRNNLEVNEENTTSDLFSVKLLTQPISDVKIEVTSSNEKEGVVDVDYLWFTPSDWNIAREVKVTSVDERVADGDQTFSINLDPIPSLDEKYHAVVPFSVSVVNIDNDKAISDIKDVDEAVDQVNENAKKSDPVGVMANAVDEDGDEVSYSLSTNFKDWFNIDATLGKVSVNGNINYEDKDLIDHTATIVVTASSTDGTTSVRTFYIEIKNADGTHPGGGDTDNFVGEISDSDGAPDQVSENAIEGSTVGIIAHAVDPDDDDVRYSLSVNFKDWFKIDADSGKVTVVGNIDYEDKDLADHVASIEVVASSTDGTSSQRIFNINILDANVINPGGGDTDNPVGDISDADDALDQVSENAVFGDAVGVIAYAYDPDEGDYVRYSLSTNFKDWFKIDAISGKVTVDGNIDYEDGNLVGHMAPMEVTAVSNDGTTSSRTFNIKIIDANGTIPGGGDTDNSVGNVTDNDGAPDQVSENAKVDDLVGIIAYAIDPDGDVVKYSLTKNFKDWFKINEDSGGVTVSGNIDYEDINLNNHLDNHLALIEVTATSTDGSTSKHTFSIKILDADGSTPEGGDTDNPVGAISDDNDDPDQVSENAKVDDLVGITAIATDPDGDIVMYMLTENYKDWFKIGLFSGEVKVAGNVDYEDTDPDKHVASIKVLAISADGSTSVCSFNIKIIDGDGTNPGGGDTDNRVGEITDIDGAYDQVSENAGKGDAVGIRAEAIDPDDDVVTYSLVDDADGRFTIDGNTGVVTVLDDTRIDYEDVPLHSIRVRATSTDNSESEATFTIRIIDVDHGQGDTDHRISVIADMDGAPDQISENAIKGAYVGITALAIDQDKDYVTYSLTNNSDGRFKIDPLTGVITVLDDSKINYENHKQHAITVRAVSTDLSESFANFTILVIDVVDGDSDHTIGEIQDVNSSPDQITENVTNGALVGITSYATDEDGDSISYSLVNDSDGRFNIDSLTGVIRVVDASDIDYERWKNHSIIVKAKSSDGSVSTRTFTIEVLDIQQGDTDHKISMVIDRNDVPNVISENSKEGDMAYITAYANDVDGDKITYSLVNNALDRFQINAQTGEVTVWKDTDIDFEKWSSHVIRVRAQSSDGSYSEENFTIEITDEDAAGGDTDHMVENIRDINDAENSILEYPKVNDLVGLTVQATDQDGDIISYSLIDDAQGRFQIDAESGVVTVKNEHMIDYEVAKEHAVTVQAISSDGSTIDAQFVIKLIPVNDPPSFVLGENLVIYEDEPVTTIKGWAHDILAGPNSESSQNLSFTLISDNDELFVGNPQLDQFGNLTIVLLKDAFGEAKITVDLQDDGGVLNGGNDRAPKQEFVLTVLCVNDAPLFVAGDNQTVSEDYGAVTVEGWASDIKAGPNNEDEQIMSFTVTNDHPQWFEKQPQINVGGTLSYTPANNANGLVVVDVVLKDNGGVEHGGIDQSAVVQFTIDIRPVNDLPVAVADSYIVDEGGIINVTGNGVLSNDNDIDNSTLKAFVVSDVSHGVLNLREDGGFSYEHDGSETASDEFTYRVNDGVVDGNEVSVSISITPVNDAPDAVDDVASVIEDQVLQGEGLLNNDTDAEGNALSINTHAVENVEHGSLKIYKDGSFTYEPDADYFGADRFVYEVCDDGNLSQCSEATVTITVIPMSDAPKAFVHHITVKEESQNNPLNIPEPQDPDQEVLTVKILQLPAYGAIATGQGAALDVGQEISIEQLLGLLYHAPMKYVGEVHFVYEVIDPTGLSSQGEVFIDVVPERVFIPEAFTPNGDDINEHFVIVGIEDYPNNKLEIYNRWGSLIYRQSNYDNSFDGHGNVSGQLSNHRVPPGTYYYVLKLNDGKKTITGSLYMTY